MRHDCEEWQGAFQSKGYGIVRHEGKPMLAHRLAYMLACGDIPEGGQIHHLCENPRCVNPDHLQLVSPLEHKGFHRKTHCRHGHAYTPENTALNPGGYRYCRTCKNANTRRLRRKAKEVMTYPA